MPTTDVGGEAYAHGYGEDFVSVRHERFDLGARVGVPEAHGTVLATAQDVFGAPFGVAGDVHWAAVAAKSRM